MGLNSFKKLSVKTELWDDMNKTTVTLNHQLECGMRCAREAEQCNVFDWAKDSKKCILALVRGGFKTNKHKFVQKVAKKNILLISFKFSSSIISLH